MMVFSYNHQPCFIFTGAYVTDTNRLLLLKIDELPKKNDTRKEEGSNSIEVAAVAVVVGVVAVTV